MWMKAAQHTGRGGRNEGVVTSVDYVDRRLSDHAERHDDIARQVERADASARDALIRLAAVERAVNLGVGMAILLAIAIPLAFRFLGN